RRDPPGDVRRRRVVVGAAARRRLVEGAHGQRARRTRDADGPGDGAGEGGAVMAQAPTADRHLSLAPRPGDAVRVALVAAFESLVEHTSQLRRGSSDPEEIHDARVAARQFRSRAVALSSVLEVDAIAAELDDLRALARALGAVRDLDVLL